MRKHVKLLCTALLLLLLAGCPVWAWPADENPIGKEIAQTLSNESVNQFISNVNKELGENIPLINQDTLRNVAGKGINLEWRGLWQAALSRLFREFTTNLNLMGKLLFLAVLCALLQNLHSSFNASGVSLLAYSICFIFLMVLVLNAFYNVILVARQSVEYMIGFMQALLPLLM